MDREVASHLAFDLSLGARLPLTRMVGTETYETTRMGASFKAFSRREALFLLYRLFFLLLMFGQKGSS